MATKFLMGCLALWACVGVVAREAGECMLQSVDGTEFAFRWCPPGTFFMGSPDGEGFSSEKPRHAVTLTQGFWILDREVTQTQWRAVMGEAHPCFFEGGDLPVGNVTLNDCEAFCEKWNEKFGSQLGLQAEVPTEARWEYACRAGTETVFSFGNSLNGTQANCRGTSPYDAEPGPDRGETTPAGMFSPNPWGIHDMHGNLWEWCTDGYRDGYSSEPVIDPTGPEGLPSRVNRGGSCLSGARSCRSANRFANSPDWADDDLGFRFILISK